MQLFDTHCHLQDPRLLGRIEDVLRRAGEAGVGGMLCCGAEESDWPQVLDLARRFPCVKPALGLHPLYHAQRRSGWLERLAGLLRESGAAVGEIGLDHGMEPLDERDQEEVFAAQLRLAVELDRPVSIHCRRAWGRLAEVLKSVGVPGAGVALHTYSGSRELVPAFIDPGAYVSFSGAITRPSSRRAHEAARAVPWDRLLVETDAPDIMPVTERGKSPEEANEPANVTYVVRKLAEIRGATVEEVAARTWENACRVFGGKAGLWH